MHLMMKTLKLKHENTKAYKLGYKLGMKALNPYDEDRIDSFRFNAGQRQRKREEREREDS